MPITLKAHHEGIYKEVWRFDTTPVFQGMLPIRVHFHAISVWPEYHQFCSFLAKDIFIRVRATDFIFSLLYTPWFVAKMTRNILK